MSEIFDYCLICKRLLDVDDKIDVKSTTTQESQVILEDFLKETILHLAEDTVFTSFYICEQCHNALNEFDSYQMKCKQIQDNLIQQFLSEEWSTQIEVFEDNLDELQSQLAIDDSKSRFKCVICNKTFTQKIGLQRHMRTHTGEQPFECEECKKKFTHHTSFKLHKMKHAGTRNFKCEICDLELICKSHLMRHIRTHTSEKRFVCSDCGNLFAERYNLVAHQKKVHIDTD